MDNKELLQAIGEMLENNNEQLQKQMDVHLNLIQKQVDDLKSDMNERFEQMNERFEQIDERFEQMNDRFDQVDNRLAQIETSLENEIRPNIQLLVEGHMQNAQKLERLEDMAEDVEYIKTQMEVVNAVTKLHTMDINRLKKAK